MGVAIVNQGGVQTELPEQRQAAEDLKPVLRAPAAVTTVVWRRVLTGTDDDPRHPALTHVGAATALCLVPDRTPDRVVAQLAGAPPLRPRDRPSLSTSSVSLLLPADSGGWVPRSCR